MFFAKCPSLISSIIKIDYDSSIMVYRESELLAQIVTEQEKSLTQFLRMKKRKSIAMSSSTFGGRKRHDKLCFCSISGDAVLKLNEHENKFCVMPE